MISCDHFYSDLLIIGGGLAGLTAAVTADLPEGMTVTVLAPGSGASPHVIGLNMPLHKDDSLECFEEDTLRSGKYQNDRALVKALCEDSLKLMPLFDQIGFKLDKADGDYALRRPLGATYPRVAGEKNVTGASLMRKLQKRFLEKNGTIDHDLRALRLFVDGGAVRGALCYSEKKARFVFVEARAVVLACGGYCNIYPFSSNSADLSGDGVAMAFRAGVPMVDMEFVQFEPTAAVWPEPIRGLGVSTTLCFEGAVLRNVDKERFMQNYSADGDCASKDVMSRAIYEEIRSGRGTARGSVYFDATVVGAERLEKAYDLFIRRYKRFGIDITRQYMEVAPAAHTALGGAMAAPDCSTGIRGLFACGEMMGGLHGANRMGGNAGLETLVFGRRAGVSAACYLKHCPERARVQEGEWRSFVREQFGQEKGTEYATEETARAQKKQLNQIVGEGLNIIRSEETLQTAIGRLEQLLDDIGQRTPKDAGGLYGKLHAENDVTAAYLVALAARTRKESVGCHVRSDSVQPEGGRYRIRIRRGETGPLVEQVAL